MRTISSLVGIRESSIYKHYSGKQAILDAIIERCTEEINAIMFELHVPNSSEEISLSQYTQMDTEDIAKLCSSMCLKQIQNPVVANFRKLLTIEQYRNNTLKELFHQFFIERPLQYIEKVFTYLLNANVLKGESPQTMALQFFSPFYLLQYQLADESDKLYSNLIEHSKNFIIEHLKEDETL